MTRNERMPFSAIVESFSQGGGVWAFIGGLFMTLCYVVVGLFGINTKGKIARDENLAQRENALIQHLVDEVRVQERSWHAHPSAMSWLQASGRVPL